MLWYAYAYVRGRRDLSKKTVKELDLSYKFKFRILDLLGTVSSLVIPWGSIVAIAYWMFGTLQSFGGKSTFADIGIAFFADVKISEAVVYLFGGGGVLYGVYQKRLRRKNIERLAPRPIELEKIIDRNRSSSGLTAGGTTRPEDLP